MAWDNVEFELEFNVPEDPEGHVVGFGLVDTPRSVLAVAYMFARVGIAVKELGGPEEKSCIWPLNIELVCGSAVEYKGPEDFPLHDVPCPCGSDRHFFVKWYDNA